jgi:outer membrane protein TolC
MTPGSTPGAGRRFATAGLLVLLATRLSASPLPDPLQLTDALRLAGDDHPSLALSRAALAEVEAAAQETAANDDLDIGARLEARLIEPSDAADDQSHNDSRAFLYAHKRLYDFGHTAALEAAADSSVAGSQLRVTAARAHHRIDIMTAFFDVVLADLEYARDNEAMAVAYVGADRTRDRNELGQVSDIEKLKKEDSFEALRIRRYRAQARQRTTRARLAQLLDRPDDLPSNLARPQLPENDQPLPDYPELVEAALARNPQVLSLKADLEAARLQIKAERAGGRPVVSGSLSASAGEREVSSRNPLEAQLRLEIPLYEGERIDAGVAKARARLDRLGAELRQLEYNLRQKLLEVWLDIQTLLAQREQVKKFTEYRDLNFDRAQAEYELELKTDFGDALVGQSESALLAARTEFQLALDWAHLTALTGEPYSPYLEFPTNQPGSDTDATLHR